MIEIPEQPLEQPILMEYIVEVHVHVYVPAPMCPHPEGINIQ